MNNDYVYVSLSDGVHASDKTDIYNGTSMYNVKKRNINKAQEDIKKSFNEQTRYNDITAVLQKYDIQYRTYCSVD